MTRLASAQPRREPGTSARQRHHHTTPHHAQLPSRLPGCGAHTRQKPNCRCTRCNSISPTSCVPANHAARPIALRRRPAPRSTTRCLICHHSVSCFFLPFFSSWRRRPLRSARLALLRTISFGREITSLRRRDAVAFESALTAQAIGSIDLPYTRVSVLQAPCGDNTFLDRRQCAWPPASASLINSRLAVGFGSAVVAPCKICSWGRGSYAVHGILRTLTTDMLSFCLSYYDEAPLLSC